MKSTFKDPQNINHQREFRQGKLIDTSWNLDLAIDGQGFFIIQGKEDLLLTRLGAFGYDQDNRLTTYDGDAVLAYLADDRGEITNKLGSLKSPVVDPISKGLATSNIDISANLEAISDFAEKDIEEQLKVQQFPDSDSYDHSMDTQVYDSTGRSHLLSCYFVNKDKELTWNLYSVIDNNYFVKQIVFDPNGKIKTVSGEDIQLNDQIIQLNLQKLTQYSAPFEIYTLQPDGQPQGRLLSTSVDNQGVVRCNFDNGDTKKLGQIAIGMVEQPEYLTPNPHNKWQTTVESGGIKACKPHPYNNGQIIEKALENISHQGYTSLDKVLYSPEQFEHILNNIKRPTQGIINKTNNIDNIAIDGNGLFIFNDGYVNKFTRNGSLYMNKIKELISSDGSSLIGYTVNEEGKVSDHLGPLKISSDLYPPRATNNIDITLMLDSGEMNPELAFPKQFGASNPPHRDTYNHKLNGCYYDSLGARHAYALYFIKDGSDWTVQCAFDGNKAPYSLICNDSNSIQFKAEAYNDDGAHSPQLLTFKIKKYAEKDCFEAMSINQDGCPLGRLTNLNFSQSGLVTTHYSNGQTKLQGQIALASVPDVRHLTPVRNHFYLTNDKTGEAMIAKPSEMNNGNLFPRSKEDYKEFCPYQNVPDVIALPEQKLSKENVVTMTFQHKNKTENKSGCSCCDECECTNKSQKKIKPE